VPVGIAHLELSGFTASVSIQVNQIESAKITSPVWDYVSTERRFTFSLCTSTTIRDGFMFYHSFLVGLMWDSSKAHVLQISSYRLHGSKTFAFALDLLYHAWFFY